MITLGTPPHSSKHELETAPALAIDLGASETRGREQAGDLSGLIKLVFKATGFQVTSRVLREVVSDDSAFGDKGEFVETTDFEVPPVLMGEEDPEYSGHWYLEDGLAPAVWVLESLDPEVSVHRVLAERLGPAAMAMFMPYPPNFPTAALPKTGMEPQEVFELMNRAHIRCTGEFALDGENIPGQRIRD